MSWKGRQYWSERPCMWLCGSVVDSITCRICHLPTSLSSYSHFLFSTTSMWTNPLELAKPKQKQKEPLVFWGTCTLMFTYHHKCEPPVPCVNRMLHFFPPLGKHNTIIVSLFSIASPLDIWVPKTSWEKNYKLKNKNFNCAEWIQSIWTVIYIAVTLFNL